MNGQNLSNSWKIYRSPISVFFPVKIKSARESHFWLFLSFFHGRKFFSRTLFHAHFGFFTDTFCDFFTGMIFIFTDVKVGFCYSFDGVNQQKFSRTPKIFHACDFEKIFTVTFCISRALFKIFSRAFYIFTGRNLKIFTEGNFIFTGKKTTLVQGGWFSLRWIVALSILR